MKVFNALLLIHPLLSVYALLLAEGYYLDYIKTLLIGNNKKLTWLKRAISFKKFQGIV
jgi:hypothetical protein